MPRRLGRVDATQLADTGSVVDGRVGVQYLAPPSGAGQAETVATVLVAREVEPPGHHRAVAAVSQETQHVVGGVVGVDPGIALWLDVLTPQCRGTAINRVEVVDQFRNAGGEAVLV